MKASGVPHVVLLSSVGADLPSGTGPVRGLYYLEEALRKTGAKVTAIRAAYFQENVGQVLEPARKQGIFPNFTPSADFPMPMIATRDIGLLAAESLLKPPAKSEVVDQMGPAYSQRQLAEKAGLTVPSTLITNDPQRARAFLDARGGKPTIHKALHATPSDWHTTRVVRPEDLASEDSAVSEADEDSFGPVHRVGVREDMALGVEDDARPNPATRVRAEGRVMEGPRHADAHRAGSCAFDGLGVRRLKVRDHAARLPLRRRGLC